MEKVLDFILFFIWFQVDQLLLGPTYATPKVLELAGLSVVTNSYQKP